MLRCLIKYGWDWLFTKLLIIMDNGETSLSERLSHCEYIQILIKATQIQCSAAHAM